MKVERYALEDGEMELHGDGGYVLSADYAALEAKCAALAAENAGLKEEISNITFMRDDDFFGSTQRAQEVMGRLVNFKAPATDAFLAEVRAQGVEAAIATAKNVVAQEFQYKDFETAQRVCSKFPESDLVGKVEMVEWLEDFAAMLRKGVQS